MTTDRDDLPEQFIAFPPNADGTRTFWTEDEVIVVAPDRKTAFASPLNVATVPTVPVLADPPPAEIVDMQIALQLQGLGTGLAANGTWSGQWAELYRLWLEAHRDNL